MTCNGVIVKHVVIFPNFQFRVAISGTLSKCASVFKVEGPLTDVLP